jgi:hypothetical protein
MDIIRKQIKVFCYIIQTHKLQAREVEEMFRSTFIRIEELIKSWGDRIVGKR